MEYSLNNRKVPGAIVWHRGKLRQISDQNTNNDYILIEDRYYIKRSNVRLAKKGDPVRWTHPENMPQRDRLKFGMRISYITKNGIIGTDKDVHEHDGAHYSHFSLQFRNCQ